MYVSASVTFIEGPTVARCILLMQFDRHTASLLMGGTNREHQSKGDEEPGTCSVCLYESSMSSGVWGSCSPRRFAAYKRGRKGGGGGGGGVNPFLPPTKRSG